MNLAKHRISVFLALSMCVLTGAAAAESEKQIEEVGKTPVEMDFPSGGELRITLCPSGVVLKGTDQNRIRVSYEANNGNDSSRVRVRLRTSGNLGRIEVRRCPHNNFRITLEVPKKSGLYVRMLAGQLEIRGIRGDKDLELSFGQMDVAIGKASDYAHADGSVNSGQVDAAAFDVSKGGLFRSFSQEGPGRYRLHAHIGAGQLTLLDSDD